MFDHTLLDYMNLPSKPREALFTHNKRENRIIKDKTVFVHIYLKIHIYVKPGDSDPGPINPLSSLSDTWITSHEQYGDMFVWCFPFKLAVLGTTDFHWMEFFPFVKLKNDYVDE